MTDDLIPIRRRVQALRDSGPSRADRSSTAAILGTVYNNGSMPTSLPGQFAVHVTTPSGAETEGSAASFAAGAGKAVFTVVGTSVPVVGDVLEGFLVSGRWVAERQGRGAPISYLITTRNCDGTAAIGVTVTATGPNSFSASCVTATITPGIAGCRISLTGGRGNYTFTVSGTSVTVTIPPVGMSFTPGTAICIGTPNFTIKGIVTYGCPTTTVPIGVKAVQNGVTLGTASTPGGSGVGYASYLMCVSSSDTTHPIVISTTTPVPHFDPPTPVTVSNPGQCAVVTAPTMTCPASAGWQLTTCACPGDPFPTTLYVTDPFGIHTLVNNTGTDIVTFPGCGICGLVSVPVTWTLTSIFNPGTGQYYCQLTWTYPVNALTGCPDPAGVGTYFGGNLLSGVSATGGTFIGTTTSNPGDTIYGSGLCGPHTAATLLVSS